ncbi:cysteine methyltransferase [Candidatus Woesearchaeota archaeon CG11_big_fil_rev_8_21_14_0_20_43_8]|nr:MAG: cysteine methyltransferase [Candidatus Woesearchaeota archaeon CG11_big_fil_rev_8_21_14_0_20_43_8]PIO04707.1 MAG: cysteine methyltransferase [Candidatus Woesearchaeota archaeon CG08_land_8_20_14_0_20_43_7]
MRLDERVWAFVSKVPEGKVTTYGEIAKALGTKAFRAIGGALSRNPTPIVVPCHRVVKSNGGIGGFFGKKRLISKKRELLEKEGIRFKERSDGLYVDDFKRMLFRF